MHLTPKIMAMRFPYRVVILDVRNQGFRGLRAVAHELFPAIPPDRILSSYHNKNTGTQNVSVHFLTEDFRAQGLDLIDEKFRHYRVL